MTVLELVLAGAATVALAFVVGVIVGAWMQEKNTTKQAKFFEYEDTPRRKQ